MFPKAITLVTLGVADLGRARAFYAALGWEAAEVTRGWCSSSWPGRCWRCSGSTTSRRTGARSGAALGTGAATLARNFASEAEVDAAFALALGAGATVLKRPEKVFWGGYSGYFADPDGHVWEVAMNPFWPLAEDGTLTLPGA